MTVSMSLRRVRVVVMAMVAGAGPQLKVMTPPSPTAVRSAASVQLEGVPVPTTDLGVETSARPMGAAQMPVPGPVPGVRVTVNVATCVPLLPSATLDVPDGDRRGLCFERSRSDAPEAEQPQRDTAEQEGKRVLHIATPGRQRQALGEWCEGAPDWPSPDSRLWDGPPRPAT